ncbi:uncharacterized protein GVI51_E05379 [Nakaseomyces glabratus]|uniref:GP-PDE domain-containing protein n=2 Tax=Candida glabrata TaxID=5478 RepID=Q6FV10_CANGA|nr:uncharacterized protein CAGL0E05654g [Nakaseomyces glabratus]KAH7588667.1 hypothetical protein J7298_01199 [Nakaseomyces glabratus]KAH7590030.1 hypothetical protein J7297_01192 [Nakaseomyces glabratus]KAH7595919.1 hypothetical protein J7296_01194 [Nakaseomyces glabratus]KAH7605565.1 hypothetical protein J7295_01200 [Nakaseomyces glabratus]KAH7606303.1 hypothetical protein J7294_01190 [Nakaseomyces glabratus]|eukprot:XP_445934.1 uncharacterized protein CAGL0E05654g [[Candida] glabrata]
MQVISHRGYKAKFPENTLLGFENAYKAGADAIETDVQVTKDGVMVINHDASTGRLYNKDLTIVDSTLEELKKLRTINGDQQILTLEELLHWLLEHRDTKLLLDVKPLLPKIAMVKIYTMMLRVSEDVSFWHEHVMWGLWSVDWVEYGVETGVLKHFDVVAITLSLDVARKFVDFFKELEDDNYNLLSISVHFVSTWTEQFRFEILPILKRERIQLFVWTVNNIIDVKYLNQYSVDPQMIGIVTDDPQEAKEVLVPAFKPLPTTEKKSDFVAFKAPKWTTKDGFRFHSYLIIYQFVTALLFSSWFRKEFVPGYSIASLMFMFLRSIHFI